MKDTGAYTEDDIEPGVKKRRIRKDDWSKIEKFVTGELDKRKNSQFRKDHERKWTEVDRQIRMEEMRRVNETGAVIAPSWNSVFELGELSKASEIICADVRRITFPQDRSWLETHVELPPEIGPQGATKTDAKVQARADGTLRSFMVQQHQDFGFKARIDLSIKEALHHGSFVAEADWQQQMMVYEGSKIEMIGAPVWVPHSMWNCYPDESPSVEPTSMFYTGSMIIRKFLPLYKLKQMKGEGWMPAQFAKIKKRDTKNGDVETSDVEQIIYYGDINIDRADGDIYLPNCKVIVANGTIVYYAPNELPFPSIIYGGYERQDPRDPYHTSPLIKQSPTQKIATICANKFIDGVSLKTEPPIVYDGTDPYFVQSDGPVIAPGVKSATKGSTDFKIVEIGDPMMALHGLEMALRQMQEGTGVSAVRSGIANSDRQTATEVQKVAQGAEVRTIDFIDKLNAHLRAFLYMQHQLNKMKCERYSFYNSELGSADFVRITKKDIPSSVHFEVVGSKGILGEEQRAMRTANVVAFASGNPLFAPLLKPADILQEMFQDAGNKNPERFIQQQDGQIPPQVKAQMQQMGQAIQQLQAELQKEKSGQEIKMQELALKAKTAEAELKIQGAELQMEKARLLAAEQAQKATIALDANQMQAEIRNERDKIRLEHVADMERITNDFNAKLLQIAQNGAVERAKGRKTRIKKTSEGFEVTEH